MTAQILLVDNDSIIRKSLKECLQSAGYEVSEAKDGPQAVEVLATRRFDLVITDFSMPHLDGLRLLEQIRAFWPNVPVIFMTGYLSKKAAQVLLHGRAEYMSKPVSFEALLASVRRLLRAREGPLDELQQDIQGDGGAPGQSSKTASSKSGKQKRKKKR
jgi:DNA-binding NtrC family response regulator